MIRENEMLEAYKSLKKNREKRAAMYESVQNKAENDKKEFMNTYHELREAREIRNREHSVLLETTKDNALSTALKAIYITALEANTLTDNGLILAENMVDEYIKENGGARAIFNNVKRETYLLAKIRRIVEDAAEEETKDTEKIDKQDVDKMDMDFKDDKKSKDPEAIKDKLEKLGYEVTKDDKESSKEDTDFDKDMEDDISADTVTSDAKKDTNDDDPEAIKDKLEKLGYEVTKDDSISDEDGDGEEDLDIDGDGEDDFGVDEPEDTVNVDPKKKMFKELEDEKEVKDAIELIRSRVSDAEEAFIKRNAQDKEKINKLLTKISDNIKTVEKISDNNSMQSKVAQEAAMNYKKEINEITANRPLSIFEKMTRNLTNNIIMNESVKELYLEDGNLDITSIVESAKVMYAFLETLNTLQFESVDGKYIQNILVSMD